MKRLFAAAILVIGWIGASWGQTAKDFQDGVGYYVQTEGKYVWLSWMQDLDPNDWKGAGDNIRRTVSRAIPVRRSARFFTYGIDFRTGILPPNLLMGFCTFKLDFSNQDPVAGTFPARLRPVSVPSAFSGADLPIFEVLVPDFFRQKPPPNSSQAFWGLHLQDNCRRGWLFKVIEE